MATQTTNLNINHVEENQNQKTVTINEAFDIFDGAIAGLYTEDLAGDSGDITPDADALKRTLVIKTTGAMSGAVNLIVPDDNHAYWVVHNATGFDLTVKTAAGTGVTISPTEAQLMYADGTNVIAIDATGSGGATQATEKTKATLTGAGGTTDVAIGANVDPNTVDTYVNGILMDRGVDYTVTESVPASGNYDTLTPGVSDIFPNGDKILCFYYTP